MLQEESLPLEEGRELLLRWKMREQQLWLKKREQPELQPEMKGQLELQSKMRGQLEPESIDQLKWPMWLWEAKAADR